MPSFDAMRLTSSQVDKRLKSLEHISDRLERYVQGLEKGSDQWDLIPHLATYMLVLDPKHPEEYDIRQDAPIGGSIGRQLKGRHFVDKYLYPAWIIQIGSTAARLHYNIDALLHRKLDPTVIDEIADVERTGDQVYYKYKKQKLLHPHEQDEEFMLFYENRLRFTHHAVVKAMKKDHLFITDPYGVWNCVFHGRVAAFFNPPSFMVGVNIRENHIMDWHLVNEQLKTLFYMATKQQSWLMPHITAARAALLKMETYDDLCILDMFLGANRNITPTIESVILVTVAMWMHTPDGPRGEFSSQLETYRELVRILEEEGKTDDGVGDMWKSPAIYRALPHFPNYIPERDSKYQQQGLVSMCKTKDGVKEQREKQLDRAAACLKQMSDSKAHQRVEGERPPR